MKRSEMVQQMTEFWLGLFPHGAVSTEDLEDGLKEEVEERMGQLLAFMEHKGMQPPVEEVDPVIFTKKYVWEKE